jgi:hypothetical protein
MKRLGQYPESISPKLYRLTPKAVFAGIAAGIPLNGGCHIYPDDNPDSYIAREWSLMFNQGLVGSPPPSWVRRLSLGTEGGQ